MTLSLRGPLLALPLALCLAACAPDLQAPADEIAAVLSKPAEQAEIEAGLIPLVTFTNDAAPRPSLTARQAELNVPAVSVAIFKGGDLHWSAFYGEGGDTDSLFQTASLSKAVAAAGILTLAQETGTDIDADISGALSGLDMAALNPDGIPITLRGLLSHTNGAAVSGFPGYPVGEPLPTTAQIVMGTPPANTDPVAITPNPDKERRYSGGGYTIAEYWAETVSGEDFAALMDRLILTPIGMTRSTFDILPPEDAAAKNIIPAYNWNLAPVEGGWHQYPESAAAGLWSTPEDYGRFVMALLAAQVGDGSKGLDPAVAREMITPVAAEYGLGVGVQTRGEGTVRLTHSGSNEGYKTNFMAFPDRGDAIIVMDNAAPGFRLLGDINRTANIAYDWPAQPLIRHERLGLTDAQAAPYLGDYAREPGGDPAFTLTQDGQTLKGTTPRGYEFTLVRIGEGRFIDPADGEEAVFAEGENGGMVMRSGGEAYYLG